MVREGGEIKPNKNNQRSALLPRFHFPCINQIWKSAGAVGGGCWSLESAISCRTRTGVHWVSAESRRKYRYRP